MAPPANTNSCRMASAMTLSRMMMRRRLGGAAVRRSVFRVTRFPKGSRTMKSSSAIEITKGPGSRLPALLLLAEDLHVLDVPLVLAADELDELGVRPLVD